MADELRTLGIEGSVEHAGEEHRFSLSAAGFASNDPAGSLLAWRGWSLHDRRTGLLDRLPLAPIPSIRPGGAFARQSPVVEPFVEIDSRAGLYLFGGWDYRESLSVRLLGYDSHGDPVRIENGQYSWDTRFISGGARWLGAAGVDVLAQFFYGDTRMGAGRTLVDLDFWAYYALASRKIGRHRLTARFDRFGVDDRDTTPGDDNEESGRAWTAAYRVDLFAHQSVTMELLYVTSDRVARLALALPEESNELLVQLSYRLTL